MDSKEFLVPVIIKKDLTKLKLIPFGIETNTSVIVINIDVDCIGNIKQFKMLLPKKLELKKITITKEKLSNALFFRPAFKNGKFSSGTNTVRIHLLLR